MRRRLPSLHGVSGRLDAPGASKRPLSMAGGGSGVEAGGGGLDALVGGGEGDPDVARTSGAVEVPRGDEDALIGQGRHRLPARLVAGGPQVQRRLTVVDAETGGPQGLYEHGAAAGVALAL